LPPALQRTCSRRSIQATTCSFTALEIREPRG
jgi:hypothetical protein